MTVPDDALDPLDDADEREAALLGQLDDDGAGGARHRRGCIGMVVAALLVAALVVAATALAGSRGDTNVETCDHFGTELAYLEAAADDSAAVAAARDELLRDLAAEGCDPPE